MESDAPQGVKNAPTATMPEPLRRMDFVESISPSMRSVEAATARQVQERSRAEGSRSGWLLVRH